MSGLTPSWFGICVFLLLNVISTGSLSKRSIDCTAQERQCKRMLGNTMKLRDDEYNAIVANGDLTFNCGMQEREDARGCVITAQQCGHRLAAKLNSAMYFWDFACENKQGFINGAACLSSPDLNSTIHECNRHVMLDTLCDVTVCFRDEIPKLGACSQAEGTLFQGLGNRMIHLMTGERIDCSI